MRRRMVVWMAAVLLVALAGTARASHEEELGRGGLAVEAAKNTALARFIRHNGLPDLATKRALFNRAPWDNHEVTLYYLDQRTEICFSRVRVLGRPEVQVMRYERTLTDEDIRALRSHAGLGDVSSTGCSGSADERAKCAATRAENAADRIDVAAGQVERAADRTEAIVEKMQVSRASRSAE